MRDYLTLVSLAVGGILLAGGNDLGIYCLLSRELFTQSEPQNDTTRIHTRRVRSCSDTSGTSSKRINIC